jgi:hypothetical protein
MFIVFVPIILLFVIGLDLYYIHVFARHVLVPLVLVLVLLSIVFSKRINRLQIKSRFDNSFIIHTRLIYFSNIGKWKSTLIFTGCVIIVALICWPKLLQFGFGNHKGVEISTSSSLVNMNQNHYENLREQKRRIPKATIDHFRITANSMELFVSFFKEDKYTVKKLKNDPALLKELKIENSRDKISVIDLYKVVIDKRELSGLRWYHTEKIATSQKGFMTTIPLDTLQPGYHELKINKLYWSIKKNKMKPIENWEFIVFEKEIFEVGIKNSGSRRSNERRCHDVCRARMFLQRRSTVRTECARAAGEVRDVRGHVPAFEFVLQKPRAQPVNNLQWRATARRNGLNSKIHWRGRAGWEPPYHGSVWDPPATLEAALKTQ